MKDSQEITTATVETTPVPGDCLAGAWIIEKVLSADSGLFAARARSASGEGCAIVFTIDDIGVEPSLDGSLAEIFGTVRRVLRDERFGRILVDEVPEGPSLAERIADGASIPLGLRGELQRRLREVHHAGGAHGALSPQLVVLGPGELAMAGWGLSPADSQESRARDAAALSALLGASSMAAAENEATGAQREREPTGSVTSQSGGSVASLRAAIVSDHLPTLRRAYDGWLESGGDAQDTDALRARDALQRLETKVAGLMAEAERLLTRNDVLGATAVCREAIRLGAEEQAEPLLKRARKQAHTALNHDWFDRRRLLWIGAAAVFAVILTVTIARWAIRSSAEQQQLRQQVEGVSRREGARQATQMLFGLRVRKGAPQSVDDLLGTQLQRTLEEERARLVKLRSGVVAQGARPLQADELSERALAQLEKIATSSLDQPGLETQFQRALVQLDRAASLYTVSSTMTAVEAAQAVDGLLAGDPVFGPGGAR